jgi:hypothetical protein
MLPILGSWLKSRIEKFRTGERATVNKTLRREATHVAWQLGESMSDALSQARPNDVVFVTVNVYDCTGVARPGPPNQSLISFALVAQRTKDVYHLQIPTCELI